MALTEPRLELVQNDERYYEFIRTLRNHPELISGFINQQEITSLQHASYMKVHGDKFHVCLFNGTPAGFIGVIEGDIRLAVLPEFQRNGVALFMVEQIMEIYPNAIAKVKMENMASRLLFEKVGFKPVFVIYEHN